MKHYYKPSVRVGGWWTSAWCNVEGTEYAIKRQEIEGTYQDHYAIYIDGKRQRKTYFGESAHWDVARAYNDLVDWQNLIDGGQL